MFFGIFKIENYTSKLKFIEKNYLQISGINLQLNKGGNWNGFKTIERRKWYKSI
ncbi:protein of unknown function [Clostridium beijerinckii]|nr:protein of unknown function [Clostridium beijerinckii]